MLAALGAVSLVLVAALAIAIALGDQRRLMVTATSPASGDSISSGERLLTITFNAEADRPSIERRLSIEPSTPYSVRWRGKTVELVLNGALNPGSYRLRLGSRAEGAGGEALQAPLDLPFRVRNPGIVFVEQVGQRQRLVAVRDGERRELATSGRIRDFAVSPAGTSIAVITEDDAVTALSKLDPATGRTERISGSREVDLGAVAWSADGQALLVTKRDRLPGGGEGVPRTSLVRLSGEFIALIDPDGNPTQAPAWSPDGQSIAYLSPATAQLLVRNLSTREVVNIGVPRGGLPAWSPDSKRIAFESVPPTAGGSVPAQPVLVKAIDGGFERSFGVPGEVWSAPRFLDSGTLIVLRRVLGEASIGTELVFLSIESGLTLRTVLLAPAADDVAEWDLDPPRRTVLYVVRAGAQSAILQLDLDSGQRTPLGISGERARWLP